MITLISGNIQDAAGNPIVPNGWIELYLSSDAQVIASPYGQVLGGTTNSVKFYFDNTGNLVQPVKIWSNAELNPQPGSPPVLGYYVVNMYDQNSTRLNNTPMHWTFPQASGSTVDISSMI